MQCSGGAKVTVPTLLSSSWNTMQRWQYSVRRSPCRSSLVSRMCSACRVVCSHASQVCYRHYRQNTAPMPPVSLLPGFRNPISKVHPPHAAQPVPTRSLQTLINLSIVGIYRQTGEAADASGGGLPGIQNLSQFLFHNQISQAQHTMSTALRG